ncbi:hypothetical protein DFJ58DRAFT_845824 [Suillus subalutaceus]|uniref:uncharacterized protein n=1 Tax=Suillus subalutaceus TaxID=48586 RepID=UPI001B867646|nr:uncharacterized protein DFJ58DRAFT_845824 [Suillus subalutaceus]KAG1839143.1 hypothetical protein DFJ58DRAFT_845824 [Suillus subalutaceus]
MYDWGLTFGQEVELIWLVFLSVASKLYWREHILAISDDQNCHVGQSSNNFDDRCNLVIFDAVNWTAEVVDVILSVIMITRLHAMYQRSRKVLIFRVVIFLAIGIANAVTLAIQMMQISGVPEELILSGTYPCQDGYTGDILLLMSMTWILATVWEVFQVALCPGLDYFRELRRHSTRGTIGDCFTVLMKIPMNYFASFLLPPDRFTHSDALSGPIFPGHSDLSWSLSDIPLRAVACAGTTPDHRCSRIPR